MTQACAHRRDFAPFATIINALNKMCRTRQDDRRKEKARNEPGGTHDGIAQGMNLSSASFEIFQTLVAGELSDFDTSAFSSLPEYSGNVEGEFYPFCFVRALENDFVARTWRGDWWDLNGGVDE
ncbi:hypothetical protein EJ02DRAFT_189528 [Clathrospora elynae]|uniref:Uncharacterized protein n=1 Tax=Clathrospora elynae TaxID=706981 RepID=A0A6A5SMD7_9PLEO|nr:hypothetical protein EJ02DRAFT_189528 [Clathrospora elynae]